MDNGRCMCVMLVCHSSISALSTPRHGSALNGGAANFSTDSLYIPLSRTQRVRQMADNKNRPCDFVTSKFLIE